MKYWLIIILPFMLSGCLLDDKQDAASHTCYEVINIISAPPNSPILVNRCNGDTYMLLRNPLPKKDNQLTADFYYGWYRIERYAVENSVAGLEKTIR